MLVFIGDVFATCPSLLYKLQGGDEIVIENEPQYSPNSVVQIKLNWISAIR